MKKFDFLEHTADIKFRSYGKNLSEVFENCVAALSSYVGRGKKIAEKVEKKIELEAKDKGALLYNFLDELIYLMDVDDFVPSKAEVTIWKNRLVAKVYGDKAVKYKELDPVKAATYSEMYIKETKEGWEAQVVLDV